MMSSFTVVVKHGGKKYNVDFDPSATGETFKYQVYSLTGVEPDRQKIIVKGGQLKDDQDLSKLGVKPGQQLMLMGTPAGGAGAIVKPKQETKFLEDMTAAEAAQSEGATPAGLQNLGNTCYMNSTLQTLRAIPELQQQLQLYKPSGSEAGGASDLSQFGLSGLGSSTDLTASLRDLYRQMSETQEGFPPILFLNAFRSAFPQFAERSRDGRGYAQQDAEEAWSQIITTLRGKLKKEPQQESGSSSEAGSAKAFVDEYLGGKFEREEKCNDQEALDAGEKTEKKPDEVFFRLNCHVSSTEVKHLSEGVHAALTDTYSKKSPTLGRDTEYTTTSRISRLPRYMPVNFVRFYWKRDVGKKAKILRRVTFPHELDCVEYCTPELREQLLPVRDKIRELRKEETDVQRSRKRQKLMAQGEENDTNRELKAKGPATEKDLANEKKNETKPAADGDKNAQDETYKTDAQIEEERSTQIQDAKRAVLDSVSPTMAADKTANQTGLYELRGVVTHQGASADSGHYTAYVKKEPQKDPKTGKLGEADGRWWWFNDHLVSEVEEEKIETLAGGGETHSALILLYRAVELPVLEEKS